MTMPVRPVGMAGGAMDTVDTQPVHCRAAVLVQYTLVRLGIGQRYVHCRVGSEKVGWFERDCEGFVRHDGVWVRGQPALQRLLKSEDHIHSQSSTLGLCVIAYVDHITTSSSSTASLRPAMVSIPLPLPYDWLVQNPLAKSSLSRYFETLTESELAQKHVGLTRLTTGGALHTLHGRMPHCPRAPT